VKLVQYSTDNLQQEKKDKSHWTKSDEKWNTINKRNLRNAKQHLLENSVSGQSIDNIKGIGPFLEERVNDIIEN
jgi:hypothetical protein